MPRILITQKNNGAVILQRLVSAFLRDTNVRSNQAAMNLGATLLTSINGQTTPTLLGRTLSSSFSELFNKFAFPTIGDKFLDFTGDATYAQLIAAIDVYSTADTVFNTYQEALKTDSFKAESEVLYDQLKDLYDKSAILPIMSAVSVLRHDIEDVRNTNSFKVTLDALTKSSVSGHLSNYFKQFKIVAHSSHATVANAMDRIDFSAFTVCRMTEYTEDVNFSLTDASGHFAQKKETSIGKLINMLTLCEVGLQVAGLRSFYDNLVKATETKISDNKTMNSLLTEAQRVRDISAARLFLNCQSWVALMQISLKDVAHPFVMDKVKQYMPNLKATYDMDSLVKDFLSLPVGKHTATVLSDFPTLTEGVQDHESKPFLVTTEPDENPALQLQRMIGSMANVIPYLYATMGQKRFWDIYRHGASLVSSAPMTFRKRDSNLDHTPVTFCQMGVMAGDAISHIDDFSFGMVFDWAVNRFNSSARTLIRMHDISTEKTVIPYYYGLIDYAHHVKSRKEKIVRGTVPDYIIGSDFATMQYPMIPIKRNCAHFDYVSLFIDRDLIGIGPASALPVAPDRVDFVTGTGNSVRAKKPVVGQFETKIDSLPLELTLYNPIENGAKTDIPCKKSTLFESLNVSPTTMDIILKNRANGINDPGLLLRFIKTNDTHGNLVCHAICRDSLFADMLNYTYFVPWNFMSDTVNELVDVPTMDIEAYASGRILEEYKRRRIGPFRLLEASPNNILTAVPGRMSGASFAHGTAAHYWESPDDTLINLVG